MADDIARFRLTDRAGELGRSSRWHRSWEWATTWIEGKAAGGGRLPGVDEHEMRDQWGFRGEPWAVAHRMHHVFYRTQVMTNMGAWGLNA